MGCVPDAPTDPESSNRFQGLCGNLDKGKKQEKKGITEETVSDCSLKQLCHMHCVLLRLFPLPYPGFLLTRLYRESRLDYVMWKNNEDRM